MCLKSRIYFRVVPLITWRAYNYTLRGQFIEC